MSYHFENIQYIKIIPGIMYKLCKMPSSVIFGFLCRPISLCLIICTILISTESASYADSTTLQPHQLKKYIKNKKTKPPKNLKIELKMASIIAEDTKTHKFIKNELFPALKRISNGLLSLKFHTGNKFKNEIEIINKFKQKKYHGIGISGMSAVEIIPEISLLGIPFLFDYEPELYWNGKFTEIDYVLERIETAIFRAAAKHDYQFCGFAETCLYFLGTSKEVKSVSDLETLSYWIYPKDEARKKIWESYKYHSINPYNLNEVTEAFNNDKINSIPAGHKALIHYNLSSYIKYISSYPICGYESAVVLFDIDVINNISSFVKKWGERYEIKHRYRFRKNFLRIMDIYLSKKMRFIIRKEEAKARKYLLDEQGTKVFKLPETDLDELKQRVESISKKLANEIDAKKLFEAIIRYRDNYRALKQAGRLDDKWHEKGIIPNGNQQDGWRF